MNSMHNAHRLCRFDHFVVINYGSVEQMLSTLASVFHSSLPVSTDIHNFPKSMLKWAFNPMLRCARIKYKLEMNIRDVITTSLRVDCDDISKAKDNFVIWKAIRLGGETVEYFKRGRSLAKLWCGFFYSAVVANHMIPQAEPLCSTP